MSDLFEYSTCKICGRYIMRQPTAPKPVWFHTPIWEEGQPDHQPKEAK